MSKFKVGDKIKILPSAEEDGVDCKVYYHIGRITELYNTSCRVFMDNSDLDNYTFPWAVSLRNISIAFEKGEQLFLWDDILE